MSVTGDAEYELRGVKFSSTSVAVSREMVEQHLGFDIGERITDMILHPEKYPRREEPTDPEIERDGSDLWEVVMDCDYEGEGRYAIFRTEAEAVTFWRSLEYRRDVIVRGRDFDTLS